MWHVPPLLTTDNSTLFIPTFKSHPKPTSSNNEAMSHGLGVEDLSKWEAHEKLRARKKQLRKVTNYDVVVKYDKFHATNIHWSQHCCYSGCTYTTATTMTPCPVAVPSPSHLLPLTSNKATPHKHMQDALCHVTHTLSGCKCDDTKCEHTTSCISPSTQIKPNKRVGTLNERTMGRFSKSEWGKIGWYKSLNEKQEKWRYHWVSTPHLLLPPLSTVRSATTRLACMRFACCHTGCQAPTKQCSISVYHPSSPPIHDMTPSG